MEQQNRWLTDPEALKDAVYNLARKLGLDRLYIDDVIELIENSDVEDAVKIVRCKDCKYCGGFVRKNMAICYNREPTIRFEKPEYFCAYGERRNDEEKIQA